MIDDIRSAIRSLSRSKGLSAVLLLSLALGTGANAAFSGTAWTLFLSGPPGVSDAGGLVTIHTTEFSGEPYGRSSFPDFQAMAAMPEIDAAAAEDDSGRANITFGTFTRVARIATITPEYFPLLRMRPGAGSLLDASAVEMHPPAAVISDALARLVGDPHDLLGQQISIGGDPFTLVGVTPAGFRGLRASRPADVWILMRETDTSAGRGHRRLGIVARPREDLEALTTGLGALSARLAEEHPETNRGTVLDPATPRSMTAIPYSRHGTAGSGLELLAIVIVAAVVLLLASACLNAATLLLSRALARTRDVAVKMALGATRPQLARQLVVESLIVSSAGGALGLLVAVWMTDALRSAFAPEHAQLLETSALPVLAVLTIGVATLVGAVVGVAPAVHGTGAPAALALRADPGGVSERTGGGRTRAILITAQLALSTLLLAATGLLLNTLARALEAAPGAGAHVAVLAVQSPGGTCSFPDHSRGLDFQRTVAAALPETPGIHAVGWASTPPLVSPVVREYTIRAGARLQETTELGVNVVTPGYFAALGIPIVEGRPLDEGDGGLTEPVAVVDERLARRWFGASAVGQHLVGADGEAVRIVGVARTPRYRTLQDDPPPTVYRPLLQGYIHCGYMFVRTTGDPDTMLPAITRAVERLDARATITNAVTFTEHLANSLTLDRIVTTIVGLCGLIALILAAMGVYGAMGDAVLRRTREIGLRLALGAGRAQVTGLVAREALYVSAAGIGLGTAGAVGLQALAGSVAHGLPALDAATLIAPLAALMLVIVVAAAIPLRRALAVSPTVALRAE